MFASFCLYLFLLFFKHFRVFWHLADWWIMSKCNCYQNTAVIFQQLTKRGVIKATGTCAATYLVWPKWITPYFSLCFTKSSTHPRLVCCVLSFMEDKRSHRNKWTWLTIFNLIYYLICLVYFSFIYSDTTSFPQKLQISLH